MDRTFVWNVVLHPSLDEPAQRITTFKLRKRAEEYVCEVLKETGKTPGVMEQRLSHTIWPDHPLIFVVQIWVRD